MSLSLTFRQRRPSRGVFVAMAVVCFLAVGLAWTAQHRFDMQPCPWCILQRILFLLIGVCSLLACVAPQQQRTLSDGVVGGLVVLLSLCGAAAAVYQNQFAAKSSSCALSLADRIISGLGLDRFWPDMFEVRAGCAEAAVRVLGIPFEFWSLALFVGLAWVGVRILSYRR